MSAAIHGFLEERRLWRIGGFPILELEEALAQVQGVTSENAEAGYWVGRTYHALGAAAYAQLEVSFPNSWRTHQLRAEGYALRQDLDDALKEYQAALELQPGEAELHEALGQLYLHNHLTLMQKRELEPAFALDSSRAHALYLLGHLSTCRTG